MSCADRDSFTSFFLIWMPFIYLSCLIGLDRTSSTIMNKSGESEHPCLVPVLRMGELRRFLCCHLPTVFFYIKENYLLKLIKSS